MQVQYHGIDCSILDHSTITTKLETAARLASIPRLNDPNEHRNRLFLTQYQTEESSYRRLREKIDTDATKVQAMFKMSVPDEVFIAINRDAIELHVVYSDNNVENPHFLTTYPMLRAIIAAFARHYRPNLNQAIAKSRSNFENIPANSTFAAIFRGTNVFINEISEYPVEDANGHNVVDPNTGRQIFHKGDPNLMKTTLMRHIQLSCEATYKGTLIMRWTLNNDTFDTMYNDLRTYVLSSSDDVPVLTTAPTTAATTLPTQQPLAIANAAIDHHDFAPFKHTPGAICKNCNRRGHKTYHCGSRRCEEHNMNFDSLEDRLRHFAQAHYRDNGHHHSRHNYSNQSRGRHNYDRQDRRRSYDDNNSRSRSRDRDPDSRSRNYERARTQDQRRSQSPNHRRNVARNSPHPERSARHSNVSFANSAMESDSDF